MIEKFGKIRRLNNLKSVDSLSILIAYLIVIVVFSATSDVFLSFRNFLNIGQYVAVIGIVAFPMTLIIIAGHIDISLGSIVALSGMVVAYFTPKDSNDFVGLFFAIFLGILTGAVCGGINSFFITKVKVNAFITTMATMNVFRGFAYIFSNGKSITISNDSLAWIGREKTLGVPNSLIIMMILVFVFWIISKYTVFGRRLYIIGGNPIAAHLSGIKVNQAVMKIFIINGAMAGLSGVISCSQLGAALPQGSAGLEFQIISAVILGGASLAGGKGSMIGSLFGVLLLATLNNGMVMTQIASYWQLVVLGIVLILAVSIDVLKNKKLS